MNPLRRFWNWATLKTWAERQRDVPMSCHCYRIDVDDRGGRIVMPEKHADWCPAGKTPREFWPSREAEQ